MAGALLVAHEDVANRRIEDGVVDREDGAARQSENDLDTLEFEGFDQCLSSVELHVRLAW